MIRSVATPQKSASCRTGPPDSFMYPVEVPSTTRGPGSPGMLPVGSRPVPTFDRSFVRVRDVPIREASSATTSCPMLCRVASYFGPGLPRPKTIHASFVIAVLCSCMTQVRLVCACPPGESAGAGTPARRRVPVLVRPPTSAGAGAPAGRVPVLGAETISVGRLSDDPPKSVFSLRSTQSIRCDEVGSLLFGGLFLARLLLGRGFLCRSFGGLFLGIRLEIHLDL